MLFLHAVRSGWLAVSLLPCSAAIPVPCAEPSGDEAASPGCARGWRVSTRETYSGFSWDVQRLMALTEEGEVPVTANSGCTAISSGSVSDSKHGGHEGYKAENVFLPKGSSVWGGRRASSSNNFFLGLECTHLWKVQEMRIFQPQEDHFAEDISIEVKYSKESVWTRVHLARAHLVGDLETIWSHGESQVRNPVIEEVGALSIGPWVLRCPGPALVLFDGNQQTSALDEFKAAAFELEEAACLGVLSCPSWPDSCLERNVRRVPEVVMYPAVSGPARYLSGSTERASIASRALQEMQEKSGILKLDGFDGVQTFLSQNLRPFAVLLITGRRSAIPVLSTLAGDKEFRVQAAFGVVQSSTKLAERLGVGMPSILLQTGTNVTTRRQVKLTAALSGPASHAQLRQLIADYIHRQLGTLGEDTVRQFYTVDEAASMVIDVDVQDDDFDMDLEDVPKYQKLGAGVKGCPPGLEIASPEECEMAIASLGLQVTPKWIASFGGVPTRCSYRDEVNRRSPERMHYNTGNQGKGRKDLSPICKATVEA